MKIAERLMTAILFGCALAPCACAKHTQTVSDSSSTLAEVADSARDTQAQVVTEREEKRGPETVTTTVEEFAIPTAAAQADDRTGACCMSHIASNGGAVHEAMTLGPAGSADSRVAAQPLLIKRTVTVKTTGPVDVDTSTRAERATEAKAETKIDAATHTHGSTIYDIKPSVGCAFTGWLYVALVLAAIAGIGYFAVKLRGGLPL